MPAAVSQRESVMFISFAQILSYSYMTFLWARKLDSQKHIKRARQKRQSCHIVFQFCPRTQSSALADERHLTSEKHEEKEIKLSKQEKSNNKDEMARFL